MQPPKACRKNNFRLKTYLLLITRKSTILFTPPRLYRPCLVSLASNPTWEPGHAGIQCREAPRSLRLVCSFLLMQEMTVPMRTCQPRPTSLSMARPRQNVQRYSSYPCFARANRTICRDQACFPSDPASFLTFLVVQLFASFSIACSPRDTCVLWQSDV
jgi:hypothetical protein